MRLGGIGTFETSFDGVPQNQAARETMTGKAA